MKTPKLELVSACLSTLLLSAAATASPVAYIAKSQLKRFSHSTHVVIMKKAQTSVVTLMPDYEGALDPFAVVTVVPPDVTPERVKTLKRDFVDHVERMSAPRFHEFWEMEACDTSNLEQEWERKMKADDATAFLGGGMGMGEKKVAKELFLNVKTEFKEGEYTMTLLDPTQPEDWLKQRGYLVPPELTKVLALYTQGGQKVLVAEVDPHRVELLGAERAQLSAIQFWTETEFTTIPARLGLINASPKDKQELFLYLFDPEQRYEVKNYENVFPPTNIKVDFKMKERVGEFYNAIYDRILKQKPRAFLNEFAWWSEGCGQPCPTPALELHELLSLGGDVFEQYVPEEEKNPKPPDLTKEEEDEFKATLEGKTPKEKREAKKTFEEERQTVASRKVLVERQKYNVTRLHYRYDAKTLTDDPKIGPAPDALVGGIWVPEGSDGHVSTEVKHGGKANRYQVRFNNFHPSIVVAKCDTPQKWRWGKAPRTYRGLRKIWIADDLTRKSRTQINPAEVVQTAIPWLGLKAALPVVDDGGADAAVDGGGATGKKGGGCGCQFPGRTRGGAWLGGLGLAWVVWRRPRRRRILRLRSR